MMKIILIGAEGKMGRAILSLDSPFEFTKIGSPRSNLPTDITLFLENHDMVLDFSNKESFLENLKLCIRHKKPVVVGITGFSELELLEIKKASLEIPIFLSSNFSVGISLLKKLLKMMPEGNYQIKETHHSQKKDSPSGTAIDLAKLLSPSPSITSIRIDDVIGIHEIKFELENESLELTHKAFDRSIFANGALKACSFLSNKTKGMYTSIYDEN
jgi:4-hydroxy-tetrahydrodipicolinate reductase